MPPLPSRDVDEEEDTARLTHGANPQPQCSSLARYERVTTYSPRSLDPNTCTTTSAPESSRSSSERSWKGEEASMTCSTVTGSRSGGSFPPLVSLSSSTRQREDEEEEEGEREEGETALTPRAATAEEDAAPPPPPPPPRLPEPSPSSSSRSSHRKRWAEAVGPPSLDCLVSATLKESTGREEGGGAEFEGHDPPPTLLLATQADSDTKTDLALRLGCETRAKTTPAHTAVRSCPKTTWHVSKAAERTHARGARAPHPMVCCASTESKKAETKAVVGVDVSNPKTHFGAVKLSQNQQLAHSKKEKTYAKAIVVSIDLQDRARSVPKGSRIHECQASARALRPVTTTEGLPACLPDSTRAAAPVRRRAAWDQPDPRSGWAECHLKADDEEGGGEEVEATGRG